MRLKELIARDLYQWNLKVKEFGNHCLSYAHTCAWWWWWHACTHQNADKLAAGYHKNMFTEISHEVSLKNEDKKVTFDKLFYTKKYNC
jgi:hypothetical protein